MADSIKINLKFGDTVLNDVKVDVRSTTIEKIARDKAIDLGLSGGIEAFRSSSLTRSLAPAARFDYGDSDTTIEFKPAPASGSKDTMFFAVTSPTTIVPAASTDGTFQITARANFGEGHGNEFTCTDKAIDPADGPIQDLDLDD
ncbi:MAG: hypothetical protein ABIJ92_04570 [Candidatus Aenigmatarchaeota archaeon]